MPIYEYECPSCGHRMEAIQQLGDPALTDCPACAKTDLRRLVSAAGFRLKGSGWYATDFKDKGKPKTAEGDGRDQAQDRRERWRDQAEDRRERWRDQAQDRRARWRDQEAHRRRHTTGGKDQEAGAAEHHERVTDVATRHAAESLGGRRRPRDVARPASTPYHPSPPPSLLLMRTHYCGQIDLACLDQEVTLCGWVHRRRDHGGILFINLRDRAGLVQVVCNPENPAGFAVAERARGEYVLRVRGRIRRRPPGMENPGLPSGEVEVVGDELEILNTADPPPFQVDDCNVEEETRLRYRYIDLRRPQMQDNLRLRARICRVLRRYLDDAGFVEIETPMLTRATPEGARDYLVPSRTHPGRFFALPQSPQLFKQLLMMSGLDRYYQIVRCFRDEDLRADRQPEFTQLDIETTFLDEGGDPRHHGGHVSRALPGGARGHADRPDPAPELRRVYAAFSAPIGPTSGSRSSSWTAPISSHRSNSPCSPGPRTGRVLASRRSAYRGPRRCRARPSTITRPSSPAMGPEDSPTSRSTIGHRGARVSNHRY